MHAIDPNYYEAHRAALFGLCYRMLGCAADAEDVVQETFSRAITSPPADLAAPIRPWLMRIATNLCIDALRRRKRESYFGPWLPAPVDTDRIADLDAGPEARYGAIESASMAFLLALEALDPKQRAVLVLRDVLGLSGPETAAALELSPENVRVIHHRARKALEAYEESRNPPTPELREQTAAAMRRFMVALGVGNIPAVLEILAADVTSVHDAGGERIAAVRVHHGKDDVVRLYKNILAYGGAALPRWIDLRDMNGLPALVLELPERRGKYAERLVLSIELDRENKIARIRAHIAERKLHLVRFG